MESPKVSVIIPLYNTQDYIRPTLESVAGQTLRDIEIIVVDDGSTDGSLQIVREAASADSRIRVFSQANQGQSVARNTGLEQAKGRYVYFMDSDDLLDAGALECCYRKCEENTLDLVLFDADIFGDEGCFDAAYYHRTDGLEDKIYTGEELLRGLMARYAHRASVCLNFIRREYLSRTGLKFYPGIVHEDELFTFLCYIRAEKAGIIPEAFFKRRFRGNSTMTARVSMRNIRGYFTVAGQLQLFAREETPGRKELVDTFLRRMINPAVGKAYELPLPQRLSVAWKVVRKYSRYVRPRTLAILLGKKPFDKIRRR